MSSTELEPLEVAATLGAAYAALGIPRLTRQQEMYVSHRIRLVPHNQARNRAGYSMAGGYAARENEHIKAVINYFTKQGEESVKVTRDLLTQMLFEAHSKAGTATEEIAAIRELGKMHGIYEQLDSDNAALVNRVEQLERMNTAQLLEMAGDDRLGDLSPENAIDADFEEVTDVADDEN